jgi:transcriptional regulator with XRE-family HTH domain
MVDEEPLGDMVRAARVARKIRPRTLAKQVGISASSLRELEANRSVPSADVVREIGHALGLKMDDVLSAAGIRDDPEQYLQSNPYASSLFRREAEGRVEANQLRQLSDAAERLERRRKKTKS